MGFSIQVWLEESHRKCLRELREHYNKLEDQRFKGKQWLVVPSGLGKRKRYRREKINNSFVVRQAIYHLCEKVKKEKEGKRIEYGKSVSKDQKKRKMD